MDGDEAQRGREKRTANLYVRSELWERLGAVVEAARLDGVQTSRREITEALWHYYAPATPAEVQVLVRAYRLALLGRDPGRPPSGANEGPQPG